MEECPSGPFITLVDTPSKEPSTWLMTDDSALPDQTRTVEETRDSTAILPVVGETSRSTTKMEPSRKNAVIDQIVMMVDQLLESTCKWKEEHEEET